MAELLWHSYQFPDGDAKEKLGTLTPLMPSAEESLFPIILYFASKKNAFLGPLPFLRGNFGCTTNSGPNAHSK